MTATLTAPVSRRDRQDATRTGAGRAARFALGTQKVLLNVATALGAISIIAVVVFLVLGLRPAIVVSGSMAPGIPVGSLTVARTVPAETVAVGDVVTVPRTDGHGLVTHRVIETTPVGTATELRLQGDANTEPDALPYTVTEAGQVLGSIPHVGRYVAALQANVVAVVAGLLVLTAVVTFPARAARRADQADGGSAAG